VKNRRQLALAVVNAVTGAQSNLSREKVQVTIDGAPCRPSDEREAYASIELAENLQRREQSCVAKVRQQLAFIPDALITVTVQIPEAEANANIGRAATQASATIAANTGRRLTAAAPVSRREIDAAAVVSASIAVPRSYFVKIYNRSNPKLAEPSDGILQPIIDSELDKIRKLVRSCLSIKNEDDVTVESYYDFSPVLATPTTETASSLPLLALLMGSRNAQIALGVMALFTFIVLPLMLIVRRRPQPSMVSSRPIHAALLAPQRLEDFENDQEFDDSDDPETGDQHRFQLEDLAAEDPNAAAEVVQRWMSEK